MERQEETNKSRFKTLFSFHKKEKADLMLEMQKHFGTFRKLCFLQERKSKK